MSCQEFCKYRIHHSPIPWDAWKQWWQFWAYVRDTAIIYLSSTTWTICKNVTRGECVYTCTCTCTLQSDNSFEIDSDLYTTPLTGRLPDSCMCITEFYSYLHTYVCTSSQSQCTGTMSLCRSLSHLISRVASLAALLTKSCVCSWIYPVQERKEWNTHKESGHRCQFTTRR